MRAKQRIWNLLKSTPDPLGYDPPLFWRGGVGDPTFGDLQLTPRRIELRTRTCSPEGRRRSGSPDALPSA